MPAEAIIFYVATKILDQTISDTWANKILAFFRPSYKTRLVQVIQRTIKEYEEHNPPKTVSGKYPFYHNQEFFEKLSSFVLFQNGIPEDIRIDFESNPGILPIEGNQLNTFFQLFLKNVRKDQKLKKLFVKEHYQAQIFENTDRLNKVLVGLISLKKDTIEIKKDTSELIKLAKQGSKRTIGKELSSVLPRLKKSKIVGRTKDLEDLKKRLFEKNQVVLMNGMGGIGKTTLAMVFLTENYDAYDHILWITSTSDDFISDFISTPGLLEALQLEYKENQRKTFDSIIIKLKSLEGKSLLIIDNATEKLHEYRTHLPGQPNWHVIVTSRDKIPFFELKELGFLDEDESVKLFKKHYTRKKLCDEDIKRLVKDIDYHTLTIEILAKTAHELSMSPEELNKAIKDNMDTDIVVRHSDQKIGKLMSYLTSTFDLSRLDEEEITLLKYISLLPSEYIAYPMLEEALSFTKDTLRKVLIRLTKRGWILYNAENDEESYKLHRIILDVIKSKCKAKYSDEFIIPLVDSISDNSKLNENTENPLDKLKWIPYGQELVDSFETRSIVEIATLQNNLAIQYQYLGEFIRAKILFTKVVASYERFKGKDHEYTSISYSNLATVHQDLGEFKKAKEFLEKALTSNLKKFGEEHPSTARSYSNLALVLQDLGELNQAKEFLEKALASDLKNFGEEHPSTAIRYSNLGTVLQDLGELNQAKELLEKALASDLKSFGEEHPSTTRCYSNLALVLRDLGELNQAKELLEKVLASDLKNFGEGHPSTAIRYSNLASILKDLGELNQAKKLIEKAIFFSEKYLGENHPDTANGYSILGHVLELIGNFQQAKVYYEKSYNIFLNVIGHTHQTTVTVKQYLDNLIEKME
ncbi:MAG: tetratricopeptide repeat protein [Bacteroidota bacterium]